MLFKFRELTFSYIFISLILWSCFFIYDLKSSVKEYQSSILNDMEIIKSSLLDKNKRVNDFFSYLLNTYKNNQVSPSFDPILKNNLKYDNVNKIFTTDQFEKFGLGSLTISGNNFEKVESLELKKILNLTPLFESARKLFPKSPWFYYTSQNFIYIYPFIESKKFHFNSNLQYLEFYKNAEPEFNPQKKMFWTNPYIDQAGTGVMITAAIPVYENNIFKGSFSVDVKLNEFEEELSMLDFKFGKFQLINKDGFFLAEKNGPKNISAIYEIYDKNFISKYFKSNLENYFYFNDSYVFFKNINEMGFYLIYKISSFQYFLIILSMLKFSMSFAIILILLNIGYWYYHRLNSKFEADEINKNKLLSLAEMSAGIAHEINNPLMVIRGRAEQADRNIKNDRADKEYLLITVQRILNSADRIAKIVKALKNFSREGRSDPFVKTSLDQIIDDTIILCENRIRNNDAKLIIDDIPQAFLNCRPYQIVQILINLINNSYDAIENIDGKEIRISFMLKNNILKIIISDSGIGIEKNIVTKMFEPFFTSKEINKGTGLGLSISKRIAIDHHGKLYYDHKAINTTFVLELPIETN